MKFFYPILIAICLFGQMIDDNNSQLYAQWQTDLRLTNDPALSSTSFNNAWCVAASGDSVHVVWYDNRDGNNEIYYRRSIDAGISWESETRLTNNSATSELPSIAVLGSVVYVVWFDFRW